MRVPNVYVLNPRMCDVPVGLGGPQNEDCYTSKGKGVHL